MFFANDFMLKDVLYIPEFSYNLLSVSAFLKNSRYSVNFSGHDCYLQDRLRSKMIGWVDLVDGIYLLRVPDHITALSSAVVCSVSIDVWHKSLGHPSFFSIELVETNFTF